MKHGCFINCICMDEREIQSSGVMKKVYSQIKVLRQAFDMEHVLVNTFGGTETLFKKIKRRLPFFPVDFHWKYSDKFSGYDFIYFRKSDVDYTVYTFLKEIKKHNPQCKILLEIPTFPYEKENFHGLKDLPLVWKDAINRKRFHRCVDRIVTYTEDKYIFGVPTIPIYNGLDFSAMERKMPKTEKTDIIEIIEVASFSAAHGYDRFVESMGRYYQGGGNRNIRLHLVGGGACVPDYKKIVQKYGIQERVIFHGWKSGDALNDIYNKADIALDVLAGYRKDYYLSSSLKSRESAAKGLPMISACKIDYLPQDYPYVMYVSNDGTIFKMEAVVDFYDRVYSQKEHAEVATTIREYAYKKCDMQFTLQPVINYILSRRETGGLNDGNISE